MVRSKQTPWLWLLALSTFNFIFWWCWTAPYRIFPADDVTLIEYGINIHIPVFEIFQAAVKNVWLLFSDDKNTALLLGTLLSNSGIVALTGAIVFKLTRNRWAACGAAVLLITNGWAASYYLMASYAPFAAFLGLMSFYLILSAYLGLGTAGHRTTLYRLMFAGLITGLFLFSSSGAPVLAFLLAVSAAFLFWDGSFKHWRVYAGFFAGPLALVGLLFSKRIVRAYIHLHENAASYHYEDALKVFKYIPRPPFFTFFRIGAVSSPGLVLLLTLAFVGVLAWVALRWRRRDPTLRVLACLAFVLAGHSLIIDLLPFTKLGRTHYPILAFGVILAAVAGHRLVFSARFEKGRTALCGLAAAVCLAVTANQLIYDLRMVETRRGPQNFFASLPAGSLIYGHPDDPTGYFLVTWLEIKAFGARSMADIRRAPSGAANIFVLGPHGERSGRTGLRHSVLQDFHYDSGLIFKPPGAEEIIFPYYGYFPGFLMEEEISMALYFAGNGADFHAPDKQITVWKW